MRDQDQRQSVLLDVLRRNQVHSQVELLNLLSVEGVEVTQATLSRDLRSIGVVKGPEGYAAPESAGLDKAARKRLGTQMKSHLTGIQAADSMLVLRTRPGHAGIMAAEIDSLGMASVLGTVAGRDTIFVATSMPGHARRLLAEFVKLSGRADLKA
ncbi:MAG: arginine repressor [Phycisphaerae bacterium]|mgnify:CR=1 FL=1|nr:arginine repressor [Phycisphaerae bacterium]